MKTGNRVNVYNVNAKGDVILEGVATLIKKNAHYNNHAEEWQVKFDGEEEIVFRMVYTQDQI